MLPKFEPMYRYYMKLPMHPDGDFFSCAVRVSMCLHHVGRFNKAAYKKSRRAVTAHGWAKRAEELYQYLRLGVLGQAEQIPISPSDLTRLPQRNGLVYLRDCFLRDNDSPTRQTGDHFDLYVDGQGMLSAIRWPEEFPNGPFGLMQGCRDGHARFWTLS